MLQTKELISEAVSLPIDLKTKLIEKLIFSINPSSKNIDKLWEEEVEKRVDEIKRGKVKLIPGEKVFKKIHHRLHA